MKASETINILLVEDNPADAQLTRILLAADGPEWFDLTHVERLQDAEQRLAQRDFDVILLDLSLPDAHGLGNLAQIQEVAPRTPIIMLTGVNDEQVALEAVQAGAQDYLVKGQHDAHLLRRAIRYAIERKQADNRLRESEERYRELFDNASDLIQSVAATGHFIYVNRAWSEVMGYTEEEVRELKFEDIIHPDYLDHCRQIFDDLGRGAAFINMETVFVAKDGREHLVEGNLNAYMVDDKFIATRGMFRDITERKRAEQAEREQRALAEALRDTAAAINSTLDLNEVFERILENVVRVVPHDTSSIMLIDAGIARIVAVHGYDKYDIDNAVVRDTLRFTIANVNHLVEMVATGLPHIIPDVREYDAWITIEDMDLMRSHISVPIQIGEETIGFLNLNSENVSFFTSDHAERLQAFANQAALAIQNARLYDETNRRRRYLETLRSISLQATPILDRHELMQAVVDGLVRAFKYDLAMIMLGDDEARELSISVLSFEPGIRVKADYRQSYDVGLVGWVMRHNKPYMTNNTAHDPDYHAVPGEDKFSSLLAVPIRQQGKVIGVLNVEAAEADAFSELDMEAMTELASELGLNLENLALNKRAQHTAALEERQRLARDLHDGVSQSLSAALVVAGILPIVLEKDPDQFPERVEVLTESLREAAGEMRALLVELQPAALVDADMGELLEQLTVSVARRVGVPTNLKVEGKRKLPPEVQIALYRITQEALNNAAKHAQASQMQVNFRNMPEEVELRVTDDGRGFDPSVRPSGHFGLGNMQQRAANIGAALNIASKSGEGTEVTVVWKVAAGNRVQ